MNKGEKAHEKKFKNSHLGGGGHRSLNQQPSGFTPILGFRKSETLKKKTKAFTLAEVLIPKRVSEIKNKVFNFRESKIKEPFNLNKKLVAFTLAEVLITLAIIGVVAALTIPTVVAKYQKHQYYTQFMKVYNTLSNAFLNSEAENGPHDQHGVSSQEVLDKYLKPYLKISKSCATKQDCNLENYNPKYVNSESTDTLGNYRFPFYGNTIILEDGSMIDFECFNNDFYITFDTNGPNKGPNTWGRDIFFLEYVMNMDNKWRLVTKSMLYWSGSEPRTRFGPEYNTMSEYTDSSTEYSCTTEKESFGVTCAGRLLLEHKMNY